MPQPQKRIVTFAPDAKDTRSHEYLSRHAVTKKLGELLGFSFSGEYRHAANEEVPPYFVPQDTLLAEEARALGINGEDDLYGGVVPHRFVATKAITHDVVSAHAHAPRGWSHELAEILADVVLPGYSAFTETDVSNAGRMLLRLGCVRVKPAHRFGRVGQKVVTNENELNAVIAALDKVDLHSHGVVLEQNLEAPVTYSIGEVRLQGRRIAYYGQQRTTTDNRGEEVYGGTDLVITRGAIVDLLSLQMPQSIRIAVEQAMRYDEAASQVFPTFFASRRNYNVVQGGDGQGRRLSGVLAQSWRYGDASAAEIRALREFAADPQLRVVYASTHETYSPAEPPPHGAEIHFDGDDERVGRLVKYSLIEKNGR